MMILLDIDSEGNDKVELLQGRRNNRQDDPRSFWNDLQWRIEWMVSEGFKPGVYNPTVGEVGS